MGRKHRLLASVMLTALIATASDAQSMQRQSQDMAEISSTQASGSFQMASLLTRFQPAPTNRSGLAVIDWGQAALDARSQSGQNLTNTAVLTQPQSVIPTNEQASQIAQTRLPVLLPARSLLDMGVNPRVMLFPNRDFYTASMRGNGLLVEVFGTRLIQVASTDERSAARLRRMDGDGFRVQQTEYGREISFNRYGAAYSITIECDHPQTDTRCTEASYGRNLARSLLIVGGTPGEGG